NYSFSVGDRSREGPRPTCSGAEAFRVFGLARLRNADGAGHRHVVTASVIGLMDLAMEVGHGRGDPAAREVEGEETWWRDRAQLAPDDDHSVIQVVRNRAVGGIVGDHPGARLPGAGDDDLTFRVVDEDLVSGDARAGREVDAHGNGLRGRVARLDPAG